MNEQGLNVWLFNKMLNILCFCFEINYHAIFFLEKNQTNTFKSSLMKDEKNPFVMEFHEQFYSLMFYGNMDKSLIMRIKKDVNTLSLNDFMSVTDNGENYTDQDSDQDGSGDLENDEDSASYGSEGEKSGSGSSRDGFGPTNADLEGE